MENINILFLNKIGNYLDGEKLKYVVFQFDEKNYIVQKLDLNVEQNVPRDFLCYDFDLLSPMNQNRYEKFVISIKKEKYIIYLNKIV